MPNPPKMHTQASEAGDADAKSPPQSPQVRFSSVTQEIEPEQTLLSPEPEHSETDSSKQTPDEERLRSLAKSLQRSQLQESRLCNFSFDAMSLPPSRVCLHIPICARSPNPGCFDDPVLIAIFSPLSGPSASTLIEKHHANFCFPASSLHLESRAIGVPAMVAARAWPRLALLPASPQCSHLL